MILLWVYVGVALPFYLYLELDGRELTNQQWDAVMLQSNLNPEYWTRTRIAVVVSLLWPWFLIWCILEGRK